MNISQSSILGRLRSLTPQRDDITFEESICIAELQATRLVELVGRDNDVRESDIAGLPRMAVVYEHLQVSGMSHWNGTAWIITLNRSDSWARQRFTLLHEFKHIIDHGCAARLYRGSHHASPNEQAERAADYFAGCALVPKRYLKSVWGQGMQRVADLAAHFGVSEDAMAVRLAQTRLNAARDADPPARCDSPVPSPQWKDQRLSNPLESTSRRMHA